ncbi:ABC transporter ATP-binding protein [Herbaspirillum lusitanum]|uniref:ABC transporter ATP-binding protein n=1 Tax=Herbaspirillum lusitanum TaxID=213312 RepID=A0ABW9A8N8_9BURK
MKRDDQAMPQLAALEQGADAGVAGSDAVLSAQRVEKTYRNGTRALDEVKLEIKRGEFVSLLGPSGCGKSTLLKMFAGLEEPSHGHIRWWGKNLATVGTPGHTLAMVFQEATLMPWASVEQNVRLPLDLKHMARNESDARVRDALKLVGLDNFHKVLPRELSGGMQMRASIARALATQPNLLLMDEPFGALDEFTRNRLDADLRDIWSKQDLTVVFVTHSIYEAVFLSSRVIVMAARPGRIIADVAIDAPGPRDDAFRISAPFMQYCKTLSDYLTLANQGGGSHDALDH